MFSAHPRSVMDPTKCPSQSRLGGIVAQGRTRVCGEGYMDRVQPPPKTRGERRAVQKGPFMDGHCLVFTAVIGGHDLFPQQMLLVNVPW